ncbi:hypothetical protein [Helicobacter heilmannii]|nr:hypothetical protein [Helicobacter heilmannii]
MAHFGVYGPSHNSSPKAQKVLKEILNTTTQKLQNELQKLDTVQDSIKSVLDNLEKDTKDTYNEAQLLKCLPLKAKLPA